MSDTTHSYVWHDSGVTWPWYLSLCHTCEWAMSHFGMTHVTYMNASCHTHECVMACIYRYYMCVHERQGCSVVNLVDWMRYHITYMNTPRHTHERAHVIYTNESYVAYMNESWRTCTDIKHLFMGVKVAVLASLPGRFMSHIWIGHVTYTNEPCHIYE